MLFRSDKKIMKEHLEHMERVEFLASVTRIRAPGEIGFEDYKEELSNRILQQYNSEGLIDCLLNAINEIRREDFD